MPGNFPYALRNSAPWVATTPLPSLAALLFEIDDNSEELDPIE